MAKHKHHKQDMYRDLNLPTVEEIFATLGLETWKLELVDGHGDIKFYRATKGQHKVSSPQIQNVLARVAALEYDDIEVSWDRKTQSWEAIV